MVYYNKLSFNKILIIIVGIFFTLPTFAQTPGDIFDAALPATNFMDPDGDGFISVNGTGYSAGLEDNELNFVAIPQVDPEPDNDTRTGGSCGATDVVDDPATGASASYVYFDDVNDIMIYRIRLAKDATGAFSFSVLVDTDGKFGFTGSNPDANAVSGNPGFEYEIRFRTGSSLLVDDVDGATSANSTVATYDEDSVTQRSYARFQDADCSGDVVFYDFYIPISDLGLTSSSTIRLAAATSSSPANSVLSNISDIAGTDDDSFPDPDDAWESLIDLQGEGTPIDNLGDGGCFVSGTSDTPVVSPIIFDSNTRINGTSTEPVGAFITLFQNNDTLGTTTTVDANGRWSVTFSSGILRPFDEITAVARDSCENESSHSSIVNVVNDLDSDNDGIPDTQEGNGVDPGADADGDNIANYLDTDYPGFVDTSPADGINDNFDPDGDGIPNHLDTDANGDGIIDLDNAEGSSKDADNDGVIDTMEDTDGDGIPDSADVDFTGGTDADNDGIDDSAQGGTDTDGDGIQDSSDPDDDGDGLEDTIDTSEGGTALPNGDKDGDGLPNFLDFDADGDGIVDATEGVSDFDGDGIPNFLDTDSDNDGILDNVEAQTASGYIAPSGTDTDGDGLDNAYDTDNGGTTITPVNTDGSGNADYIDVDSDGDGVGDFTEGNDNNLNGISDVVDVLITGGTDSDSDGIDDTFDASVAACTDNYNANDGTATADGICDNVQNGTATDTDSDGLPDIYDTDNSGTAVVVQDSDGDGVPNYKDTDDDGDGTATSTEGTGFTQGGSPIPDYLYNPDFDGDGFNDSSDLDSDNDGILDSVEDGGTGFDPTGDADSDGVLNYVDQSDATSGFPSFVDSNNDGINDKYDFDLDGIPDFRDRDTDNDGIVDLVEAGGTDANGDGIVDSFTDTTPANGLDDSIAPGLTPPDSDSDGFANYRDIDSDNDGIVDNIEAQTKSGYTAPSGNDTDGDGIDNSYDTDNGGTALSPVNTDSSGNPDYFDTDSDGDGINDIIEGHDSNTNGVGDWDSNSNGVVDGAEGTGDSDNDGLLDAFDNDNSNYNVTGSNAPLQDTDGNGTYDYQDADDDGDGTNTATEGTGFTQGGNPIPDYLYNPDTDGDGVLDSADLDSDNDGIPDANEDGGTGFDPTGDADSDGILNYLDQSDATSGFPSFTDTNSDGINDAYDADLDGIPNFQDLDSDNDGSYDIIEAGGSDSNNDGVVDSSTDTDGDGLADTFDSDNGGTALANADSDGDGVTNAFDRDSDNDGIPDIIENGGTDANGDGINDTTTDTDGDGIVDTFDTDNGGAPVTAKDTDGDGVPDIRDRDSDGDGISDLIEAGGTDSDNNGVLDNTTDTDGDGFADLIDPDNGGSALTNADTDSDGVYNFQDGDSDADGITDNVEAQTTSGFTAPNDTADANGFDTAYSGAGLTPIDTDNDGTPDYIDSDSDGDSISDAIEGNDANNDGTADSSPSGTDTDGDGIDNTFDPDNGGTALTPQNLDADSALDYRDTDDDADGIKTVDEPLDINPVNGTLNYLENSVGSCGVGFITTDFSGSADAVFSNSGVTNFSNATGTNDAANAVFDDTGDFFILDLTDVIPQSNSFNVRYRTSNNNKSITLTITTSLTSGGSYGDTQTFTTSSTTLQTEAYTVNTSGGIRYVRVELTAAQNPGDGELDALTYSFTQCDADYDLDGVKNTSDNDDDNDGIPDITEVSSALLADDDGDGTLNFEDSDYGSFVDSNSDGIDDNADFDLDGIPNHKDLDSDNDGIPDATEANGGSLPANMIADGRFTVSYVQSNDNDNDGLANIYDTDDGGSAMSTPNTDSAGSADFLDTDADGDGQADYVEANDDDGSGDSLNDYITRAANFEAAAGSPGYYTTTDTDTDGIPDWLEDNDSDGIPNFLDPFGAGSTYFRDTDSDGLIDLFDTDNSGTAVALNDNDSNSTPDYIQSAQSITLPVELVSFTAKLETNYVLLQWVTAQELNNDKFEIERSSDGKVFKKIGFVKGVGNSSESLNYSFKDTNPLPGRSYYRLKQVDFNKETFYSNVIEIMNDKIGVYTKMNLYPNPTTYDNINIKLNSTEIETAALVRIVNLSGIQVFEKRYYPEQWANGISLKLPNNSKSGMYIVIVQQKNKTISKKLLLK